MPDASSQPFQRPLGAFEKIIDLYIHRNPVQFTLVVELEAAVDTENLASALRQVQRRHLLLAAQIDRSDPATPVFRQSAEAIPVRCTRGSSWEQEAAVEQTLPVPTDTGSLVRAVLLRGDGVRGARTLLLTFSHQIADGRGALLAIRDLLAALAGEELTAGVVPLSQEDLLAETKTNAGTHSIPALQATAGASLPDPAPAELRPFDGSAPTVQSAALTAHETRDLRSHTRSQGTTVQAALCSAAAIELAERHGTNRVRINVPIDLRGATDLEDEVVIRFTATMLDLAVHPGTSFWELAREATEQLKTARRPVAASTSAMMLAGIPATSAEDAEAAMLAATAADLEITNLGVAPLGPEQSGCRALWGPTMTTQIRDEQILGVVTHGGVLRLTLTSHDPEQALATHIAARLTGAVGGR